MGVKIQPRTARGFRDFLPAEMLKREYVINTVRQVFELYGFERFKHQSLN